MRRLALILLVVGCGGDSGTGREGIYSVLGATRNPTACDVEGPPQTGLEPFFYIKNESFIGAHFVNVKTCMDATECEMEANESDTIHIGRWTFEEGSDSDGWTNRSAIAFEFDGTCMGGVTETSLKFDGMTVRIEERSFDAVPFPPSAGEDECPDEKVEAAIEGVPCEDFEVVEAAFQSDF
jgi:hypothetical protein